ncbi:hypothetical protein [Lacticaseibacillus suilingensis]|uniref:hypothetical protein n=1 Tax=Lacticaseibacillus suilingensis TaxID=2799577 RepID=UPI0022E7E623|nr:hypothetical protein [Lacticaseibacillus suilingensis]
MKPDIIKEFDQLTHNITAELDNIELQLRLASDTYQQELDALDYLDDKHGLTDELHARIYAQMKKQAIK